MNAKEKAIQEQRINLATRNNIMGSAGKLGIISKWLGSPIIRQRGGLFDVNPFENQYAYKEDGIHTAYDDNLQLEGYVFDGLSKGMHLEIKYCEVTNKLTADYKGYRVYTEVAGDLYSYAPFEEWEKMVDKLYKQALERQRKHKEKNEGRLIEEAQKEKLNFLQRLRLIWGI